MRGRGIMIELTNERDWKAAREKGDTDMKQV